MDFLIEDIRNIIFDDIDLRTQLKLKCINNYWENNFSTQTIIKYKKYRFAALHDVEPIHILLNSHAVEYKIFEMACCENELSIAKFIANNKKFRYMNNFYSIADKVCKNNHLDILKWMYHSKCISLLHNNCQIFITACLTPNIDIVKWIYTKIKDSIKKNDLNRAFNTACLNGHLLTVQFLWLIGASYGETYHLFPLCYSGTFHVLEWLINESVDVYNLIPSLIEYCIGSGLYTNAIVDKLKNINFGCGGSNLKIILTPATDMDDDEVSIEEIEKILKIKN